MPTEPDVDATLREVRAELRDRGFEVQSNRYFGGSGLVAFIRHDAEPHTPGTRFEARHIAVIERGVFLYPRDQIWEARVTYHGGRHLVRQARTVTDLIELALTVLENRPTLDEWPEEP